jgi:RNA polymerase sigma factor (TIGR02999 family)
MEITRKQTVNRLLQNCREGNREAADELFEILYDDLYRVASARRRSWQNNQTLNTTALIHETYLKLIDQPGSDGWQSKAHFLATASRAMRHILINYARDSNRLKRGGDWERVSLQQLELSGFSEIDIPDDRIDALLKLGEALQRLDELKPRLSRIVECRIFGGMTIEQTAEALDISPITVTRGWKTVRLWLSREMKQQID